MNTGSSGDVKKPSADEVITLARRMGFVVTGEEAAAFSTLIGDSLRLYNVFALPELQQKPITRDPGSPPAQSENKLNAWTWRTNIVGASSGKLAGKKIALKDTVSLAGIPMRNGTKFLEGFIPQMDATVVTRILEAGGTIIGKTTNEYLCYSAGSHTSYPLPVINPYKPGVSSGGSSSGSAVVVATKEADMAIGGDQGGSIRCPSCWCGVYGMKPTYGLVPCTHVASIEYTIDHIGPITGNVMDNAVFLEILAGVDGMDYRQLGIPPVGLDYTSQIKQGVKGMKIGVVKEGFSGKEEGKEKEVDDKVKNAVERFKGLGALVEEISIPWHTTVAFAVWNAVAGEGASQQMLQTPTGNQGMSTTDYLTKISSGIASGALNEFPYPQKVAMLTGKWMYDTYHGEFYSRGQNLRSTVAAKYNEALANYNVLVFPTLPIPAPPLPANNAPIAEIVSSAFGFVKNTAPFDVTGHPAMNVPCGMVDGSPIGLMLVGKHLDEATIYKVAYAFEQNTNWKEM